MALLDIEEPTPAALRWFGLPFAICVAGIGALVWRNTGSIAAAGVIWAGAAAVLAGYYALPRIRRFVYLGWIYAAYPIGFVMSHVAMAVIYYLVITPIGLVLRATGRDAMNRKFDPHAQTYWEPRRKRDDPGAYFRQF